MREGFWTFSREGPFLHFHALVKSDGAPSIQLGVPAPLWFLQNEPLGCPSLPCLAGSQVMHQPSGSSPRQLCVEQDLEISSPGLEGGAVLTINMIPHHTQPSFSLGVGP